MGLLIQTLRDLGGRVRRRPVRSAALSVGVAGVAAAVAIPVSFGGGGSAAAKPAPLLRSVVTGTSRYSSTVPMKLVSAPWSNLAMDGQRPENANDESGAPWFDVVPGEKLTFAVTVTVPAHAEMTKLFIGITNNAKASGIGPRGPIGMAPVLATASRLTPGTHRFTVRWTVPLHFTGVNAGYAISGAAYWPRGTKGEPQAEEGAMANVFAEPAGN
jgi:hypothetical protein